MLSNDTPLAGMNGLNIKWLGVQVIPFHPNTMENYDPPYNTPWPFDESTINYYGGNSGNRHYWTPVDGRPVKLSSAEYVFPKESTEYPTDLQRSPTGYFFLDDNLTNSPWMEHS